MRTYFLYMLLTLLEGGYFRSMGHSILAEGSRGEHPEGAFVIRSFFGHQVISISSIGVLEGLHSLGDLRSMQGDG